MQNLTKRYVAVVISSTGNTNVEMQGVKYSYFSYFFLFSGKIPIFSYFSKKIPIF